MSRALMVAALALAAGGILACPKPGPTPVNPTPDASDAAAPPVSCSTACAHADAVCPGNTCWAFCPRVSQIDPGYTPCIMAATGCYNCDATARAAARK